MNKALKEIIEKRASQRNPGVGNRYKRLEYLEGAEAAAEILEAENAKLVAALENYEKQIIDFKQILKTRDKELATIEAMYNRAQRYIDEGGDSETIISTTRHGKVIEAGPVGDEFPEAEAMAYFFNSVGDAVNGRDTIRWRNGARWGFTKGRASRDAEVAELRAALGKFCEYFEAIEMGEYDKTRRTAPLRDFEHTLLHMGRKALGDR